MKKRNLRVVKWLASTPVAGECTQCRRQFSVPLPALRRVSDAQESLRKQFTEHKCAGSDQAGKDKEETVQA
jgi:hypothetical protein